MTERLIPSPDDFLAQECQKAKNRLADIASGTPEYQDVLGIFKRIEYKKVGAGI